MPPSTSCNDQFWGTPETRVFRLFGQPVAPSEAFSALSRTWYTEYMDKTLHNVADLPAATRSAVEALVGHPLRDSQKLYILALERIEPPADQRQQAWDELTEILNESHENVRKSGVSPDEVERLIDEACAEVRYGKPA